MALLEAPMRRLLDPSLVGVLTRGMGTAPRSVLMFSGGRDSTIAAMRMYEQGLIPILVTVSSGHLIGINRVQERVQEMERYLPIGVPWLVVRQPAELKSDTSFYDQTCLPCHHAYVVAGAAVAAKAGVKTLAFGYASYQNSWPEQTTFAIERLTAVLGLHGIRLLLPVYNLASREQAVEELTAKHLSPEALEQKCIRQVANVALGPDRLSQQIDLWEHAIDTSMSALSAIDIEVIEATRTGSR